MSYLITQQDKQKMWLANKKISDYVKLLNMTEPVEFREDYIDESCLNGGQSGEEIGDSGSPEESMP